MHSSDLSNTLAAGSCLVGSSRSESTPSDNLKSILLSRLAKFNEHLGRPSIQHDAELEGIQLKTGEDALYVVERIQHFLTIGKLASSTATTESSNGASQSTFPDDVVPIGARDLAQIRTLLSLAFKWAIEPLLKRILTAIPSSISPKERRGANIIDLTTVPDDYKLLSNLVKRFLDMIIPNDVQGPTSDTIITPLILSLHLTDILRPCIVLGWLPKPLATASVPTADNLRPLVMRLLSMLSVSQNISALGGILADSSSLPLYVRKTCGFLLSRQLLRPEGVQGLCSAVFADEEVSGDDAPLEKLEHVSKLLSTVPSGMNDEEYFKILIPRILILLSDTQTTIPPAHRRAVAFTLSRLLVTDGSSTHQLLISGILLPVLHRPFLCNTEILAPNSQDRESKPPRPMSYILPSAGLQTLQTVLTNTDPSPNFIATVLTPIIPALFEILSRLDVTKIADPATKESLKGLLGTWGRVVAADECVKALWLIVNGEGGEWQVDVAGELRRVEVTERPPSLSLFTPEDLKRAADSGELDIDSNILDLRPDPVRFVRFVKSIDRPEVASEVFVKALEAYRETKATTDSDPVKTLLYLQLVVQMQSQLSSSNSASNILSKPEHILSFVKHALESAGAALDPPPPRQNTKTGLKMEDLRIVEIEEEDDIEEEDGDSDDEPSESEKQGSSDDEMTVTALNLLLSILEANPNLSARTAPILNDIFSLLEELAKGPSESIRPLAREARMVMTARLASTSVPITKGSRREADKETPQEIYQKALKLLQDPLLPVRAHGLLLLRQLVSARPAKPGEAQEPPVDRALIPAILSIFMQSVQDDDSYIYLNAVQGLAAMVDGFGKDVLKGLISDYMRGLDGVGGSAMTQQEVDMRTRVGEALGQVIRRCGDALPAYAGILVPPISAVVRAKHVPTTLRTSALSLLAQCTNTCSLAILPYALDLAEAMIDLLQVETVPAGPPAKKDTSPNNEDVEEANLPAMMDSQPTSTYSKFPPLRRAALHLLALLIRAKTTSLYDSASIESRMFPIRWVRRAKATLGYVAATDEDVIVRVMAREALEGLGQMIEAMTDI